MLATAYSSTPSQALAAVACQKHQMAIRPIARLERLTWFGVTGVRTRSRLIQHEQRRCRYRSTPESTAMPSVASSATAARGRSEASCTAT